MKSPFPGMDPFIEVSDLWGDFHEKLVGEIERDLSEQIPEGYVVRLAKRTYIELTDPASADSWMVPDVGIAQTGKRSSGRAKQTSRRSETSIGLLDGPVPMHALVETEFRETYAEIYEAGKPNRLVTCIEVLSPANKRKDSVGWSQYVRKRQALLHGAANFVEIDFLRGGDRMPMHEAWPGAPYYVLVSRRIEVPACLVWPVTSIRAIPEVPVPLLPADADLKLDLQRLIDAVYRRSRYFTTIDYQQASPMPLTKPETALLPRGTSRKKH